MQMMYKTPNVRITVNSTFYNVPNRETLSTLIFVLAIESLMDQIRNNNKIQGIQSGPKGHKMAMYMEYVILYLTNTPSTSYG